MDFERKDLTDDIWDTPNMAEEIGTDDLAVEAAGLSHPDELELESILAEDWDSIPDHDEQPLTPEEALNNFLYNEDEVPVYEEAEPLPTEEPTRVIPVAVEPEADVLLPAEMPEEAEIVPEETYTEEAYTEEIAEHTQEDVALYEEEEDDQEDLPVIKTRPKWKKGYGFFGIPHIAVTAVWLAITVMIGVSLGRILWVCCADMMSFGKPPVTAYITVTEADNIETVSQKMADAGLIRYPGLFQKFADITKKSDRIQAGIHELGSHLDYNAMINTMVYVSTPREEIEITIPEGYTCAQIFKLLQKKEVCTIEELEKYAATGELKEYWFLEGVKRGDKYCLEGYLAPDTYRFYTNDKPRNVLEKLLNAFDARFTDIMKEDFETMQDRYAKLLAKKGRSKTYIKENPLTLHQVLTVASVVERETANDAESYEIAAVFYNRVANPDIGTMGSDATVYYAVGDYTRTKKKLTKQDLASKSPYNTRKAVGFPPGPICNPGPYALYAALDPNDNDYQYFVYYKAQNKHLFAKTYSEHQKNVKKVK